MKRRTLLQGGTLALCLGQAHIAWGATIVAVRVWPAADYTRVHRERHRAQNRAFVCGQPTAFGGGH